MHKVAKTNTNVCTLCEEEEKTTENQIREFPIIQRFLENFSSLRKSNDIGLNFIARSFIFGQT